MEFKTPGVFVEELNAFPNAVVGVATAVTAFVGHTERAADAKGESLRGKPVFIASMADYSRYFGAMPQPRLHITAAAPGAAIDAVDMEQPRGQAIDFACAAHHYRLTREPGRAGGRYLLPQAMRHFFDNGGGACCVVSVGGFDDEIAAGDASTGLIGGPAPLLNEAEPTIVVVPDAVLLSRSDCTSVQAAMLAHCGSTRSRVAILDVWGGDRARDDAAGDCIERFRADLAPDHRSYAAAYFPWLHTSVLATADVDHRAIDDTDTLIALLKTDLGLPAVADESVDPKERALIELIDGLKAPAPGPGLHNALLNVSPLYKAAMTEALRLVNLMPPSATMGGVYALTDNTRGVWKAPANVGLIAVNAPAVDITDAAQEDLNMPLSGIAVNAIRSFAGRGPLVWGARTLDGHSADWRYVSVRRTAMYVEQSCVLALKAYIFEPNDAGTWAVVRSMLGSFLNALWKQGGLMGAKPDDAYAVQCGLGQTMTAQDVADGRLGVTLLLALLRPAEFIVIRFEQQQAPAAP